MAEDLENVYKSFCQFGAKDADALMDNSKLAKLTKDLKLLDKKLTATDVDIIFSKVKGKNDRKIDFKQFQCALKLMAEKKFPGDGEGYIKLEQLILSGDGPGTSNTTKVVKVGAVDRLTDTSQYTGSHKERFDSSGKGRGAEGRTDMSKNDGYVAGYKNAGNYGNQEK